MAKKNLSVHNRRRIVEEYKTGMEYIKRYGIDAIARRYGISTAFVSQLAKKEGLCRHYRKSHSLRSHSTSTRPTLNISVDSRCPIPFKYER